MRISVLLILCFVSMQFMCAQNYVVLSPSEEVFILKSGEMGKKLRIGSVITLKDSVIIQKNGFLRIKDTHTSRLYANKEIGALCVQDIINSNNISNESVVVSTIRQGYHNVTKKDDVVTYRLGGSKRGSHASLESQIAQQLLSYFISGDKQKESRLVLKSKRLRDGVFYFEIENRTKYPLYLNVLAYDKVHNTVSVVFKDSILYGEHQANSIIYCPNNCRISFPNFTLLSEQNLQYLLFGLTSPFDCCELENCLASSVETEAVNSNDFSPAPIVLFGTLL